MNFTKLLLSAAAVGALSITPALAQSAGTSDTGTTNGVQGTPGHPAPSSSGTKAGDMSGSGAGAADSMSGSGAGMKGGAAAGGGAGMGAGGAKN